LKKGYLPLITLVAGFGLTFLAAGVSSFFFILLPITTFVFGYFSSWRWGLLGGLILSAGYTFAILLIWWGIDGPNLFYLLPGITAFIAGGFSLLIIGVLATQPGQCLVQQPRQRRNPLRRQGMADVYK
jgi:hypothetical protein